MVVLGGLQLAIFWKLKDQKWLTWTTAGNNLKVEKLRWSIWKLRLNMTKSVYSMYSIWILRCVRKKRNSELTTGRGEQLGLVEQSLWGQAAWPWPSKYPPPFTENLSRYRNPSHVSMFINSPGFIGALTTPLITNEIGPLHGPENVVDQILNVPFGIKTLLFPGYLHASSHAFKNA